MKPVAGLLACALFAACASVPPPRDPEVCLALFRDLDRVERAYGGVYQNGDGDRGLVLQPAVERIVVRLNQNGCVTRDRDLMGMETAARELQPFQQVPVGQPLPRPVAVQAGVVAGIADEVRVKIFFGSLGYNSRSVGLQGLGRLIYIGPFRDTASLAQALEVARLGGFISPYASESTKF